MAVFRYLSYDEFKRLLVCLCLDSAEYVFLFLMPPLGEIFGIASLAVSLMMFGWVGLISGLDMVPEVNILPINTITWLVWFLRNHAQVYIPSEGLVRKEYSQSDCGYLVKVVPDGKPIVWVFRKMDTQPTGDEISLDLQDANEPLVDIMEEPEVIKVIAELPGVVNEDIRLYAAEKTLTIDVSDPEGKYHKELELPNEVEGGSTSFSYRNGVLEAVLRKRV